MDGLDEVRKARLGAKLAGRAAASPVLSGSPSYYVDILFAFIADFIVLEMHVHKKYLRVLCR